MRRDSPSASVVQIESAKLLPFVLLLTLMSGGAVTLAAMTMLAAAKSETETRMLEYYVLEMDAKLIAAGIKKPEEAVS
jgi:hypothetical protein